MSGHDPRFDDSPLNAPGYQPLYPPVEGKPNPVVAKWGANSQLRWFFRFWGSAEMPTLRPSETADYFCQSTQHKGTCCSSCLEDYEESYDWPDGDRCCCRSEASERGQG